MAMWQNKYVISADIENVGQGHYFKKSYLGSYSTDYNQTFTKRVQLGMATKTSRQLTLKMSDNVILTNSNISAIIQPI